MEHKKQAWKPNLFDLLLVLAALAVVGALVGVQLWRNRPEEQTTQEWPKDAVVRYTVELNQMTLEAAQAVQPGDELVERSLDKPVGVVESVEVHLTQTVVRDENTGEQYYTEIPERYTATIVLTAEAKENRTNFTTENGLVVRVGTAVRMLGPGYYGTGYIVRVERSAGNEAAD